MKKVLTLIACTFMLFACAQTEGSATESANKAIKIEVVDKGEFPPIYKVVENAPQLLEEDLVLIEVRKEQTFWEMLCFSAGQGGVIALMFMGFFAILKWFKEKVEEIFAE